MRKQVDVDFINKAMEELREHVAKCMIRHGHGTFASKHEAYGILAEEVKELLDSIEKNKSNNDLEVEFKDVAQVCVFALACLKAGTMEW